MPLEEVEEFLRSRGDWLGASCVARYRDEGFLFAAAVRDTVLELSGIGGKVEPGERFRDAALREFEEETGTRPDVLVGVERPRHLTIEARDVPVPEGAAALVAESADTHPVATRLWIAVFLGLLWEVPRPVEKIRHFVVVPPPAFATVPPAGVPGLAAVGVLRDGVACPATEVLPARVQAVTAVHTARVVLGSVGLLAGWWRVLDALGAEQRPRR